MPDALRTNDPVQLSFGEAVLVDAGISVERTEPQLATYSEVAEPIPGRLIVDDRDFARAVAILRDAFGNEEIR